MAQERLSQSERASLLASAREVRERAYAPYSGFQVAAALLSEDGRVFLGVNVENSAYPIGLCAERAALASAVVAGARRFRAVAVVTPLGKDGSPGTPCGACRQALSEFGLELEVLLGGPEGEPVITDLRTLLPMAFSGESL